MIAVLFFLVAILFAYSFGAVSCYLAEICSIEFYTEHFIEFTKDILTLIGLATILIGIYIAAEE